MSESPSLHWDRVYQTKQPEELSWHQAVPTKSMSLIRATQVPVEAPVIDVGGGASKLAQILTNSGYTDVTVLDVSAAALARSKELVGAAAQSIHWIEADVTAFEPTRRYYLWHDRAAFHFLTDPADVQRYLDALRTALIPGGHFIVSTFGPDGPDHCSGLHVQRYSVEQLTSLLESDFDLRAFEIEDHVTPTGTYQQFLYTWWQVKA